MNGGATRAAPLRWGIAAVALIAAQPAAAQCIAGINCKFSVSGKKGAYLLKQVSAADLTKADAESAGVVSDGRSLDSISLNKGSNAGTGIRMPNTERQLALVLERLRGVWPHRMPPAISVRIVGNTSYNAAAHPDNVVVIPLGLLIHAKSDDEVFWVLAHEFSHIGLAHFSREARQRRLKTSIETAVDCTRLAMDASQIRVRQSGNQLQLAQVQDPGVRAASLQVWAKSNTLSDILEAYNQRLSRRQEDQADAAGVDLVLKLGYSEGYGAALDIVRQQEERQGSLLKQFGTELGDYTKRAGAQLAGQMLAGQNGSGGIDGFLKGLFDNAGKILYNKMMDSLLANHRPAAKRKEGLGKYLDTAYKEVVTPETVHVWLDAVRGTAEFKEAERAVNANDAARLAIAGMGAGDTADAAYRAKVFEAAAEGVRSLQPALQTRYANTPLIANTLAKLNEGLGKDADADRLYDVADRGGANAVPPVQAPRVQPPRDRKRGAARAPVAAPPAPAIAAPEATDAYLQQSLDGFNDHVTLLLRTRNYPKALAVIERAKKQFGDDDKFLPALITIYAQQRKTNEMVDAIQRCARLGDEALQARCTWAPLDPAQREKIDQLSPVDQARVERALAATTADARKGGTCRIAPPPAPARDEGDDDA